MSKSGESWCYTIGDADRCPGRLGCFPGRLCEVEGKELVGDRGLGAVVVAPSLNVEGAFIVEGDEGWAGD